ncbi:uncharacterized protein [Hemitrygon akajei]|uniref:uncharacterized protein isoform X1 n=1 Tax=Hemitrygon akajei TaxID=2704970 RepID=UPI003BF95567
MSLCPSVLPTVHSMCPTLVHRGPSVPQYSLPFTVCVLPLYTEVPLSLSTPYHSQCVLPLYTEVPLSLSTPYRSQWCPSTPRSLCPSVLPTVHNVSSPCTPRSLCPSVLPTVHSMCPTPRTPRSLCPSVLHTFHSVCPTLVHRPSFPQYSLLYTVCVLPSYTEVPLSLSTPYRSQCVSSPCTPRSLCPSVLPTVHSVCPTLVLCPSVLPTVHSVCPTLVHRVPSVPQYSLPFTVCVLRLYTEVPLSLSTPTVHSVCPPLVHQDPSVPQYSLPFTVCVLRLYTEVPLSLSTPYRSQYVSYPCTPRSLCPSVLPTVHSVCPTLVLCPSVLPTVTVCVLPSYTVPLSLSTPYCTQCVSYPRTPRSLCPSVLPTVHSFSYPCTPRSLCPSVLPTVTVCVLPLYTEVPLSLSTPYRSQCVSYPCTPRSLCPSVLPTVHSVCPTLVHPVPSVPQYSLPFTVCLTLVH